jgi:hypothetical protein
MTANPAAPADVSLAGQKFTGKELEMIKALAKTEGYGDDVEQYFHDVIHECLRPMQPKA